MIEPWFPPLLWAGVIAIASGRNFSCARTFAFFVKPLRVLWPGIPSPTMQRLHVFARKAIHWGGYFVLTLLIARAFRYQFSDASETAQLAWTFLAVALIATLDELRQTIVPNRQGSLTDVMIDLFGSAAAILLLLAST